MIESATEILLTEDEKLVRDACRDFAIERIEPLSRQIDKEHNVPMSLIKECADLGFLGVCVPEVYGGSNLSNTAYALIVEELARGCASTCVVVSAHNSLAIWPILTYGTEEQKQKYLPAMVKGDKIGCFALSEPGTGSDAARQTCMAKYDGDGFIINGVKNWITNSPIADVCVLFTMEDPAKGHKGITAFIVDMNTEGVSVGHKEDKLGICGSPTASIIFDNVKVPDSSILGKRGDGFKVAMSTLDGGRIGIASQASGIAGAAMEAAIKYTTERQTFGKFIHEHQSIQNYMADMSTELDAGRLLALSAARRKDAHQPYGRFAAQAKLFASETAMKITNKAIQIHGGYGYVKDFNVERHLRDAKITEIYEGTSEIQRLVIAAGLLKEFQNV